LTHGNAADGSDQVPVAATDVIVDGMAPSPVANGIVRSIIAAHVNPDVQKVGYIGGQRYIRLAPTFGGVHATGTPIDIICELRGPDFQGAA
jgi:hypothetical protein